MAWAYSAFESESTDAARLAMLRLHLAEVEADIDANLSSGAAGGMDNAPLTAKMERLYKRLAELTATVGTLDATDVRATSGFTRGRCI